MPLVGDAFQFVLAGVVELEPGARGEVFDRGADQNLPGACERADPGADVDREGTGLLSPGGPSGCGQHFIALSRARGLS
jgi:hypothetical protein